MTTSSPATVSEVEKATRKSLGSRSIAEETKDDKDTAKAVELAPPPLPVIEDSCLPVAEIEEKDTNAPLEEAVDAEPVALPQTPPRKRSTVTSNPTTPPTSPTLATMAAAKNNVPIYQLIRRMLYSSIPETPGFRTPGSHDYVPLMLRCMFLTARM